MNDAATYPDVGIGQVTTRNLGFPWSSRIGSPFSSRSGVLEAPRVDDATDSKYPNAWEVASSNASNTSRRVSGSPRAQSSDTDLSAEKVTSHAATPSLTQAPTQLFTGGGVLTVEQANQTLRGHRPPKAQLGGAVAAPLPGGGTTPQVVVLPG